MTATPRALVDAHKLIKDDGNHFVLDYRILLALVTPPDQYRVTYYEPVEGGILFTSLVPRLIVTPDDFEAWQAWLDSPPEGTS